MRSYIPDQYATNRRRGGHLAWISPLMLGCFAPTGVYAGPAVDTTTEIRLRYDRREAQSAAGARSLLHRIDTAALEACGASSFSLLEIRMAILRSRCWRDAVDAAMRQIESPALGGATREARQ